MTDGEEIWKPLPGWAYYLISNHGRVLSYSDKKRGALMNTDSLRDGYKFFVACEKQKKKNMKVHQAVALAFIGPCPDGMQVRHLDDDRMNNRLDNLVYGTPKQNKEDALRNGVAPVGERVGTSKLKREQVLEIASGDLTLEAASEKFNVSQSAVSRIRKGETWARETGAIRKDSYRERGENHCNAKLTDDIARKILMSSKPATELADIYGVNKTTILQVRRRNTWRHVKV